MSTINALTDSQLYEIEDTALHMLDYLANYAIATRNVEILRSIIAELSGMSNLILLNFSTFCNGLHEFEQNDTDKLEVLLHKYYRANKDLENAVFISSNKQEAKS